jgi:hypothetical protein
VFSSRAFLVSAAVALSAVALPGAAQASAQHRDAVQAPVTTAPYIITRTDTPSDRLVPDGWSAGSAFDKAWGGANPGYDEAWEVQPAGAVNTGAVLATSFELRFRRSQNMCMAVYGDTRPGSYLIQEKCDPSDPGQLWLLLSSPTSPDAVRIVPSRDLSLAVAPQWPVLHDTWVTLQVPSRTADWNFDLAEN